MHVSMSFFLCVDVSINFVGQVHTSSSISLDWDLPPVTGLAAQVDHYLVNIDELETSKNWTFFAVQSHATILSLHPYFTYICRVAIVTNLTHPYTSTISLRTLQERKKSRILILRHFYFSLQLQLVLH